MQLARPLAVLVLVLLAGPVRADAPEQLTVVERLRVENNTLKMALVVAEARQLVTDIEAAHPCCTWNTRTQALDPKPVPKAP